MRTRSPLPGMRHLNGDVLIAINAYTTGPDPTHDEIVQVGAVFVDEWLQPVKDRLPFTMKMRPTNIHKAPLGWSDAKMYKEEDPHLVAEVFVEWLDSQGVSPKQFQPLLYNAPQQMAFLRNWIGSDTDRLFGFRYRDILPTAMFVNDHACFSRLPYPCPKHDLSNLATRFGVKLEMRYDALHRAVALVHTYRSLIRALGA